MLTRLISGTAFCLGLGLLAQGLYMPSKALLAKQLIQQAWHDTLQTGEQNTPWPWMDAYPVAQLTLPNSDKHIVLNTDSGQALAFGPGLVSGTDLSGKNMVAIAAHKNTQFNTLKDIKIDDVITLTLTLEKTAAYHVKHMTIIDTREAGLIEQDGSTLALITCYPFDAVSFNGPLRYVVYAEKIKA